MDVEQLAQKLLTMAKTDRVMREKAIRDSSLLDSSIDKAHTKTLKKIIKQFGWPTIPMVGEEASSAAWLLAQHADHDLEFQKHCLTLMKNLDKREVSLANIAYLEDRVRLAQGLPQLYGTQFIMTDSDFSPRPIFDSNNLDKRRADMGLGTFDDYKKSMLQMYGSPTDQAY